MLKYIFSFIVFYSSIFAYGFPQWYYDVKQVSLQKEKFKDIMLPMIKKSNTDIIEERKVINEFFSKSLFMMGFDIKASSKVYKIAKKYNIRNIYNKKEFLKKINTIPVSMVLAQAAVESAWGKSRFVKVANNIFGQWTYNPAIGVKPKNRDEGKTHFIRKFDSLQESVSAYMLNLNRNRAYREFRNQREKLKDNFTGIDGAKTMINYSGIGDKYIEILVSLIESNNYLVYEK
jgi:Bax protein